MKKYQMSNVRPAGDSDEYDDDSDGFEFGTEDKSKRKPGRYINYDDDDDEYKPNIQDFSLINEQNALEAKRNREFEVFKACTSGNIEVVKEYLAEGSDVNGFLHSGWTLMLYAASTMQLEIIQLLLEAGANPNVHKDGYTPLMALCNSNYFSKVDKSLECLNLLVKAGANPNATSKNRETPLIISVKSRDLQFIEELLKLTTNRDLTDSEGNTALHYATFHERVDVVKLLLQYKVDTTIVNRRNLSAYDTAVVKQYKQIAELLTSGVQDDVQICDIKHVVKWQDMFPDVSEVDEDKVLQDISTILYGMGLERYKSLFKGMNLRTFLTLTDKDLMRLGMDLSIHRKRFLEDMYKFHSHQWNPRSLGFTKSKTALTIFDGIQSLGNLVKKFCVIGSSLNYIRQSIMEKTSNAILLSPELKRMYEIELEKTEETMTSLKTELETFKIVAKQIELENQDSHPATYISKKKNHMTWPIVMTVTAILSLYLSKSYYTQRFLPIGQ